MLVSLLRLICSCLSGLSHKAQTTDNAHYNRSNALAQSLGSHFFQSDILTPVLAPPEEADNTSAL